MNKWQRWFDVIENERIMMFFVLALTMLVAAFSIMNTMITVTVQKRKEIGMMRALGAKPRQVIGVFLWKGIIVGAVGTICGLVSGLAILHFRNDIRDLLANFGFQIFPPEMYMLSEIPARLVALDVALICLVAFFLCSIAAIPPAWVVTRLDPAKALRNS